MYSPGSDESAGVSKVQAIDGKLRLNFKRAIGIVLFKVGTRVDRTSIFSHVSEMVAFLPSRSVLFIQLYASWIEDMLKAVTGILRSGFD